MTGIDEHIEFRRTFERHVAGLLSTERVLEHAAQDRAWPSDLGSGLAEMGWPLIAVRDEYGGLGFERSLRAELYGIAGVHMLPASLRVEATVVAPALANLAQVNEDAEDAFRQLADGQLFGAGDVSTGRRSDETDGSHRLWASPNSRIAAIVEPDRVRVGRIADPRALEPIEAVEVPSSRYRLAGGFEVPEGWVIDDPEVVRRLRSEWQLACLSECAGVAQDHLQRAAAYAQNREQFGRPIGRFQAVAHLLAEMASRVELARASLGKIAIDDGPDGLRTLAAAGVTLPQHAREVCEAGIQIHGGMGFAWETGLHLGYRRVLQLQMLLGGALGAARSHGQDLIRRRRATR